MAGVLFSVEDSLDDQLVRLILPAAPAGAAAEAGTDHDAEFRQVSEAVLRECIVNLARVKEAVSIAVQKPADLPAPGPGQRAAAAARHHGRSIDARQEPGRRTHGCHRRRSAQADRAGCRGSRFAAPGAYRGRHRQHRVLHGDGAERARRSVVHAGQRRDLSEGAGRGCRAARAERGASRGRRRQDSQIGSPVDDRAGWPGARRRPPTR